MMLNRQAARINAGNTYEQKHRSKPHNGPVFSVVAIKGDENNNADDR